MHVFQIMERKQIFFISIHYTCLNFNNKNSGESMSILKKVKTRAEKNCSYFILQIFPVRFRPFYFIFPIFKINFLKLF